MGCYDLTIQFDVTYGRVRKLTITGIHTDVLDGPDKIIHTGLGG
jgi:hypothetical protein